MSRRVAGGWNKHFHDAQKADALSGLHPLWYSLFLFGASRLQANGCCPIPKEGLPKLFGKSRQDINRAIRTAVQNGYLDESSVPACLRLAPGRMTFELGSASEECVHHPRADASDIVREEERSKEDSRKVAGQSDDGRHSVPHLSSLSAYKPIHSMPTEVAS